ncbi:MAG: AAA family ATPase [Muribaculaceae bacterium]|nr:AAA family ATPase [Muribaculaceae bacterium]
MDAREFAVRIMDNLPYEPNGQQIQLIAALARFCSPSSPSDSLFLLNGYAGTGKTSLTGALVKALADAGVTAVLLAPTGRAAKVFASFAHHTAYTIHRKIYRASAAGDSGNPSIAQINENKHRNAVFIVDEASMIGSGGESGSNLLEDLIHYVYTGENCRMILLGDTAQLPPVGCAESPAMSVNTLRSYGLRVTRAVLTETVRQRRSSGILFNATWLRRAMRTEPLPEPELHVSRFDDVESLSGELLADSLSDDYSTDGIHETIMITRSNKRATQFNLAIRANILYREEELCRDELLLIAKNNYHWSSKIRGLDFIANGDTAVVTHIYGTEEKYGFRFADVTLSLPDRDIELDCKILLDTLTSETPGLDAGRFEELYRQCLYDPDLYAPDAAVTTRLKGVKSSPYFNALQVKYAYAVTCHKAQGGQWRNVYVDMGYIPPEAQGMEFYRWLYTATSRATHRLYYVNPSVIEK